MKRFIPAAIFILVALLLIFAAAVYADPSWESFNDDARSTVDNDFAGSETTVYMQGVVTASTTYDIAYYEADTDGAGADAADRVATDADVSSNAIGVLQSELTFTNYPTSDAGTWHSVVFSDGSTIPDVYDGGADGIEEDDSFNVQASAIPEFPTAIVVVVAMGLSFGIYYWMRKRCHRQVVTVNSRR